MHEHAHLNPLSLYHRICQAHSDNVDVINQRCRQPFRVQNANPEIRTQICRLQVSLSSALSCLFNLKTRKETDIRKSVGVQFQFCYTANTERNTLCSPANKMLKNFCASCSMACTMKWTGLRYGHAPPQRTSTIYRKCVHILFRQSIESDLSTHLVRVCIIKLPPSHTVTECLYCVDQSYIY